MNKVTIRYPREQVEAYIKHSLDASPLETVVVLVGVVRGGEGCAVVEVERLVYPEMSHQSSEQVRFTELEMDRIAQEVRPLKVVGTIHSQPDCGADPSEGDIRSASRCGEVVFGVLGMQEGKEPRLAWYVGMPEVEAVGI